ncbi:MAG: GlsB/YeaQ/YmgE family stress response membrane protein [Chloroflexota bacterium]|nr:GlsB/YeaQ/YmgE family stress response membrane protein [Chloroflexota bacterium]
MGLLAWIIFGALAGWLASIIMGTNRRQGCLLDIVVGVVGAFIGGFLMQIITGRGLHFGFDIRSFIVAVLGAVILLVVVGAGRRRR